MTATWATRGATLLLGLAALAACDPGPTAVADLAPAGARRSLVAEDGRIVVFPADVRDSVAPTAAHQWVRFRRGGGTGSIEPGPPVATLGTASLHLSTVLSADKAYLFNYDHAGTPLASIQAIGYASLRKTTSTSGPAPLPALNLEVDFLGDGTSYTVLVFEPYQQPAGQAAIVPGQWQTWDAYRDGAAKWWSSRTLVPGSVNDPTCRQAKPCTWSQILALHPNARIMGGVGINQGSGNPGLLAAADGFRIDAGAGLVTYDFELGPLSKDECKASGWRDFGYFANQGDCVSFVAAAS